MTEEELNKAFNQLLISLRDSYKSLTLTGYEHTKFQSYIDRISEITKLRLELKDKEVEELLQPVKAYIVNKELKK